MTRHTIPEYMDVNSSLLVSCARVHKLQARFYYYPCLQPIGSTTYALIPTSSQLVLGPMTGAQTISNLVWPG